MVPSTECQETDVPGKLGIRDRKRQATIKGLGKDCTEEVMLSRLLEKLAGRTVGMVLQAEGTGPDTCRGGGRAAHCTAWAVFLSLWLGILLQMISIWKRGPPTHEARRQGHAAGLGRVP